MAHNEMNVINDFCYDSRTGYIKANDKYIVKHEKYNGTFYFFIKYKSKVHYLTQQELAKLRQSAIFFTERGCDFGEAINTLIKNDYLSKAYCVASDRNSHG